MTQPVDEFIQTCGREPALQAADYHEVLTALHDAGIDKLYQSGGLSDEHLQYAMHCSGFIKSIAVGYSAEWVASLQSFSDSMPDDVVMQQSVVAAEALIDADDQNQYMKMLRDYRNLMLANIALYDLLQLATPEKILTMLSDLADACIKSAVQRAHSDLAVRYGEATSDDGQAQQLIVVAMGKLGGRELNFSSDIDLVFLHREAGETNGKASIDNEDFFRRVGQLAIKYLDATTTEGFVYRVDMRLRPLGRSGPLVINLDAFENYLLTQGRDWERFAWIKARVVCGSDEDKLSLKDLLRPFIYRRYLDYSIFESLRDLKRQIGVKVDAKGAACDVKLGRGGIREIEFIAQSFQLVRGGRDKSLQLTGLRDVFNAINKLQLIEHEEVNQLLQAYDFLRKLENRLQMFNDQQTHLLPSTAEEQNRVALSMCYSDYKTLLQNLTDYQDFVQLHFDEVFSYEQGDEQESNPLVDMCLQLRDDEQSNEKYRQVLSSAGFSGTESIESTLQEFYQSGRYQRYLSRSRELMEQIIPNALHQLGRFDTGLQSESLIRLLEILHAVSGRSGYLQLLSDSDQTLSNLLHLLSQSPWLAEYVGNHPMVLDELLNISRASVVESVADTTEALRTELVGTDGEDLGELMDRVRHFQQARTVRIAAADISGALSVMQVSDGLTWLAEAVLEVTTEIVGKEMQRRHGVPCYEVDGKTLQASFSIAAYGKLGGVELGYGSDLDIIFLHQSEGANQVSNGEKPLENTVYFSRMAQKLVHFLTTMTPAGVLYDIDTRLRPNGRSGVLVITLAAFREYQFNNAWTWEHQALVRARVVVGSMKLRRKFAELRAGILKNAVARESLQTDVREMRERMRRELDRSSDAEFDLKQGGGGIADIEFMVQYLVLKHANDPHDLLEFSDNVRQLDALSAGGHLNSANALRLKEAYLYLRGLYHKQSMQLSDGLVPEADVSMQHRAVVRDCWQQLMID